LLDRTGCLIANHGSVTVGPDLRSAYELTRHLEWLCEVYLRAAAAGRPSLLTAEEIDGVRRALDSYGQP
jgi:L-fuculose-phosphate aldolase